VGGCFIDGAGLMLGADKLGSLDFAKCGCKNKSSAGPYTDLATSIRTLCSQKRSTTT
jgi:hypothetical protein